MSQNVPGHVETFVTGADLSAHRYKFLKVSADNTVSLATAMADPVLGIQWDTPFAAAGAQVAVMLSGTPMVMAGAAFSAGAKLTPNGSGLAIVATAGQAYFCIAIQAATASGDIVQAKWQTGHQV
jgi:hypothetical protein